MNKDLLFISNSFSVIKINALTYKTFALVFVFLKKKKNSDPQVSVRAGRHYLNSSFALMSYFHQNLTAKRRTYINFPLQTVCQT